MALQSFGIMELGAENAPKYRFQFLRVVIPTGGRNLLFAGGEDSRFLTD
jgi:hypothetical protein